MSLSPQDRRFLDAVDRLKIYLLGVGIAVLLFLLCTPPSQVHFVVAILGIALCGMFWLTQQLLNLITVLDLELTDALNKLERPAPSASRGDEIRREDHGAQSP